MAIITGSALAAARVTGERSSYIDASSPKYARTPAERGLSGDTSMRERGESSTIPLRSRPRWPAAGS
jgi:hypothetical protein